MVALWWYSDLHENLDSWLRVYFYIDKKQNDVQSPEVLSIEWHQVPRSVVQQLYNLYKIDFDLFQYSPDLFLELALDYWCVELRWNNEHFSWYNLLWNFSNANVDIFVEWIMKTVLSNECFNSSPQTVTASKLLLKMRKYRSPSGFVLTRSK